LEALVLREWIAAGVKVLPMSRILFFSTQAALLAAAAIAVVLPLHSFQAAAQTAPTAPPQPAPQGKAEAPTQEPKKNEDGRYVTAEGTPTYKIGADGTLDWYTFSGFRRYHAECHTCHGPEGEGSSYAPALVNSLKTLSYEDFTQIVVNGKQSVNAAQQQVMPAFGENANVMCYLDDIYVYLKARSDGALARGRPAKREDKPEAATKNENTCFGRS
jgi:methanol metabolism-related c-type cytochrome